MMLKERASGMYRLSAFYIARTASDLPIELATPSIFIVLIYFMVWPILPHPLSSALLQSAACLIVLHQGLEVCLPRPPVYQLASIASICIALPPPGDSGVLQPPACSWESNVGSRVRGV